MPNRQRRPDPPPSPNPATRREREGSGEPSSKPDLRVTKWHGFTLSAFQIRAVEAVRAGKNVLVAAPTGAGKTLVAEYAMEDAVQRGGRCIYTSPIKALSNQKYRDFRDDPEVDVGIMTGDVTIQPGAQVLIMTTEILRNAIFENSDFLADVEYVIFDEIHYMDDRERGTVWEESLIFLPERVRLICLSATVSNVDELGSWLAEIRTHEIEIVRSDKRPVPLSHWFCTEEEHIFAPDRIGRARKRAEQAESTKRRQRAREKSKGGRRGRPFRGRNDGAPDPSALFDHLQETEQLPALVFSFSRKDCERLALANGRRRVLDAAGSARMEVLQKELIELFQLPESSWDDPLFAMARRGVSYHHAGMLPVQKEVVERMFTEGLLRLLFTTETFALGINMPARSVVFNALRKFDGISFDWLRTRDFQQMAGRAGRQGIDDKGFVYCLLGDRDVREAPLERLIAGKSEPVRSRFDLSYSSLLHLVEVLGRERVPEAWQKSFHQYQGRERNKTAREKQRRIQQKVITAHLELLEELGYLRGDQLTARGRIARLLNGYELSVTELLFRGVLENLPPRALAVVFVGLVWEERGRDRPYVPARLFGDLRHRTSGLAAELCSLEERHGVAEKTKRPDWGLTAATLAWIDGVPFEELEAHTDATPGDVCRTFRMTLQLMKNVRRAIDPDWDLSTTLRETVEAMNRDEIDARRQLELG